MVNNEIDFGSRLLLNFISIHIGRLFKILVALYSVGIYNQWNDFKLLKVNYVRILDKLIISLGIECINKDINNLKDIIKISWILNRISLSDFQWYPTQESLEETVDSILNPVLREIEFLSVKYNICEGMYYLVQIKDISKINDKNINNYIFDDDNEIDKLIKNDIIYDKHLWDGINKFINNSKELEKLYIKNDNDEIKISDKIIYYRKQYVFKNVLNKLECSIKLNWDYDKFLDILLDNIGKTVTYSEFEKYSWMKIFNKRDSRCLSKIITDIKANLYKKLVNNLDINLHELVFLQVDNWIKIIIP